jgi:hypothetical protein
MYNVPPWTVALGQVSLSLAYDFYLSGGVRNKKKNVVFP